MMNIEEKIDFALLGLYKQTKDGTMLKIRQAFLNNGQELSLEELQTVKDRIKENELAVFQLEPQGKDYRGQIIQKGIEFVQNNSFSKPGTSILKLEE